jgi:hypothetical protein
MKKFSQFLEELQFLSSPKDDPRIEELLGCDLSEYDTEYAKADGVWEYCGAHFVQYKSKSEVFYEVAIYNTLTTFYHFHYAAEMLWDEYVKGEVLNMSTSDKYCDLTDRLIKFVDEPIERGDVMARVLSMEARDEKHLQHLKYYTREINELVKEINS